MITVTHRRQTMGNGNQRAAVCQVGDRLKDGLLSAAVEGACSLVEHEYLRVGVERTGDADALALATTQADTTFPHHRGVAMRKLSLYEIGNACGVGGALHR